VWDTLAIAEYLDELMPAAGILPTERIPRAHCRAVSGEMHSGFYNLRSALPMKPQGALPRLQDLGRGTAGHRAGAGDLA